MSKQFRVYVLPSDAEALVRELKRTFGVAVFAEESLTPEPTKLTSPFRNTSLHFPRGGNSMRCYLTQEYGAIIDTAFYENPERWIILPSSEAIEISGCDFDGLTLMAGRIYFQSDELVNGVVSGKRSAFLDWANDVFRHTKKLLHRYSKLDAYVGADAEAFIANGGRFASHVRPNGYLVYDQISIAAVKG